MFDGLSWKKKTNNKHQPTPSKKTHTYTQTNKQNTIIDKNISKTEN